jgi:hypothetical protein
MAILDFLGNCSVHFAISIWTLTSVAVLFGESSKNFQGTLQEIFLLIGDTLHQQIIDEVNSSPVFSILVDEATDISVKCQMVIFIQYLDKLGNPVVNFLESRDVLGDSVSADSETLHRVLKECTKELDGNKLCVVIC